MAASLLSWRRRLVAVAPVLLLAVVAFFGRRCLIADFFVDGRPGSAPKLLARPVDAPVEDMQASRLRVVLIDGLSAKQAATLPTLDRLCAFGLDLEVDNGFPTVSLPVQHVLWTGLTQPQSGIMYRVAPLPAPPPAALPHREPTSIAVAESHAWIVESFGFSQTWPPSGMSPADSEHWQQGGFAEQAEAAVAGDARLVFVHVLRVDEAGHAEGAASARYAEAADWADALVGRLVDADARPDTRWVVLSDHGHRPGGGHGGAQRVIRVVRACVFGDTPAVGRTRGSLNLVDLHRFLADSLGLEPDPSSAGRPLGFALANPQLGSTLIGPGPVRWGAALVWLAIGLAATGWAARGRVAVWPFWFALAYASVVWFEGRPSLSNPAIYPPLGLDMLVAALPGFVVLVATDWAVLADTPLHRRVVSHLALPVATALAALTLCAGIGAPVGLVRVPPLVPRWTAHASLFLTLVAGGACVVAVAALVRPRRTKAPQTEGSVPDRRGGEEP